MRALITCLALSTPATGDAQQGSAAAASWDVTQARGRTREIDFSTTEGTWMSVDLSPDGTWIAFDLLGHIYRIPVAGGEARALTQNSGVAVNYHPRISPDGRFIAFVSDRKGQNNLWIMNADGSNPRAVFTDNNVRVFEPAWTPDGDYIVVRRQQLAPPGTPPSGGGIWMYHRNGGEGVQLVPQTQQGAAWPSLSRDGRWLYFQVTTSNPNAGHRDFLAGAAQVRRLDIRTGEISAVTSGEQSQQVQSSSGGAAAPEVSPDGRWLAFARRIPDGTISYKGHRYGPRTALWLRDLVSGRERLLMDPIELDMVEGFKVSRVLPGYSWARDGRSIVISQGGGLRRVDVESGRVTPIPFTARVHRTISEMAYKPGRISDDSVRVKFARWHTASPDGRTIAFQALGRVWVMDARERRPRRLTASSFAPFELAPAWSPDGRWIAFTSWDDTVGGHLWKVPARGGTPTRLTSAAAEYIHPAWSADGREIVLARGAGETMRGRGMLWNAWWDVVRVPASGGAATFVYQVRGNESGDANAFNNIRNQIVRPTFGPDGRIFFPILASATAGALTSTLVSVRPDGSDRRSHLTFAWADEVIPSPDGKWAAFQEADNVYVVPLPLGGTGSEPPRIERRRGKLPVTQLSREGGLFPRWRNARTLEFGSGMRYYAHRVDPDRLAAAPPARTDSARRTRTDTLPAPPDTLAPPDTARPRRDTLQVRDTVEVGRATLTELSPTDTIEIRLSVPAAVPSGTIALTNARIVTLANRQVIERGSLVVRRGRIACVGECATT
ncbi:MAG TPA: hypothetical protein VJ596_06475 [Gemmatimonadaceae bacterium]|nr:hypothetical protein [Gemmatimonadaceae bacterium]